MTWTDDFHPTPACRPRNMSSPASWTTPSGGILVTDFSDYITGPVPLNIEITSAATGKGNGKGSFDLRDSDIDMPFLNWSKSRNEPGKMTFAFTVGPDGLNVKDFDVTAGGLTADGSLSFTGADKPLDFTVRRVTVGKTDVGAQIARDDTGKYSISVKGASYDAGPMIDSALSSNGSEEAVPDLTFTGNVDRLIALNGRDRP